MLDLRTLPFTAYPGPPPEQEDCAYWPAYALPTPPDRLPPFVLSRPYGGLGSRLSCASLLDAITGRVLTSFDLRADAENLHLSYQKITDGTTEWLLYYGGRIAGLSLPCQPVRLLLDNSWQSAPLLADVRCLTSPYLEFYHRAPLGEVPYGPGTDFFAQRLYMPGTVVTPAEPARQSEQTTDKNTGLIRLGAQTLTPVSAATVAYLPAWALPAWQGAALHSNVALVGNLGPLASLTLRQTDMAGADSLASGCRFRLELTMTSNEPVTTSSGCATGPTLRVEAAADDYSPRGYLCQDSSDTEPDWQRTGELECEQDQAPNWQRTGEMECEQA